MAIRPLARAACAALLLCLPLAVLHAQPQAASADRKPGDYPLGPDSQANPAIAHGQLLGPFEFRSKVIAGTVRRYWVYVPAGYKADAPQAPNLLVFQDGQRATNPGGPLRIQTVLDNLIAKRDIAPTIGIFVTPGKRWSTASTQQKQPPPTTTLLVAAPDFSDSAAFTF